MSAYQAPIALFRVGRIVATPNALEKVSNEEILVALQRHQAGDWGEVDQDDHAANNRALTEGTRLLSVYNSSSGIKFWIITEADPSATTILLPEDY